MTQIRIVPLEMRHIGDAAALVIHGYERERKAVPALTERPLNRVEIEGLLQRRLTRTQPLDGVAAISEGKLVGFLMGVPIPNFWNSHGGVFCSEWSHAAEGDRKRVYRDMYAAISKKWIKQGLLTHAVALFAHDEEAQNAWYWTEFGLRCVDAIRALEPLSAPIPPGVEIRKATTADLEDAVALRAANDRHMATPPMFMPYLGSESAEETAEYLEPGANALFIAYMKGAPVAYMRYQAQPELGSVSRAVIDPKTVAINGAYTVEDQRRGGIASALLDRLMEEARTSGYERVSVDFEGFNIQGSGFWLRYFTPVCYSLGRKVDDRILL